MKKAALFFFALAVLTKVTAQTPKTDAALNTQGTVIKNETSIDANTPLRVGTFLLDENASKVNNNQYAGVTLSGTDTYTGTVTPAIVSYPSFYSIKVKFTNANSGASTLALNGLAAKNIKKILSGVLVSLSSGDICANCSYWLMYNGTDFQILGGGSSGGGGGGGTWGTITGTLTDQVDLSNSLSSKQPALNVTAIKSSAYNAVARDFVPVSTAGGSITITLPTAPPDGTFIGVKMVDQSSSNTVTVAAGGSDLFNVLGGLSTFSLLSLNQTAVFQFHCTGFCASGIWYSVSENRTTGITNTAISNEIPKSNGTNIIPSGLFSSTSGSLDLGSTSISGDRTISAKSSSASNALFLQTTNSSGTATNALQIFISGTRAVVAGVPGQLSLPTQTYITSSLVGSAFGFDFANFSGMAHVSVANTSGPNSVLFPSGIVATTNSGTPSNGFGVGMKFLAQNSAGTNVVGSTIHSVFNNVTPGSEGASFVIQNIIGGTLAEKIRFTSQGEIGLSGANFGTSGQVLTSGGVGAAASWTTVGGGNPFSDATAILKDNSDATKLLRMELGGFTMGTTRVLTPPNFDGIIATTNNAQTISGVQTFSSLPTIPVTPVASTDAVSKGYVDGLTLGPFSTTLNGYTLTSGGAGKLLLGDNTWLAAGTSGKVLVSNGTTWINSTPTFPNASATTRKIIVSDGTNWTASTETYAVPGTSGNVLTSNGTNWTSAAPISAGWNLTGATNFTGPVTINGTATNTLTWDFGNLGTTDTDGAGGLYTNTTAATPGTFLVSQNHSPNIAFKAFAYKSNATAASESSVMRISNDPLQSTTGIVGNLVVKSNINGGGDLNLFTIWKKEGFGTTVNIYNSYTNPSTYDRLLLSSDFISGGFSIMKDGPAGPLYIGNEQDGAVQFRVNSGNRWVIYGSATAYSLVPNADNVYDLGGNPGTGNIARNIYGYQMHLGGSVAPVSTLDVSGSAGFNISSTSTDITLDITHHTILVDASGANRTITLPAASGCTRRTYVIKKSDSSGNSVTIDGNASETIDGATTKTVNTQYSGWEIHGNGTAWSIIATF